MKIKLGSIFVKLTQRHNRREQVTRFEMNQDYRDTENCASTQVLRVQKYQVIDLQEHLERYCIVIPVFGSDGAKYYLNWIKSYLLNIFVNEPVFEPTVIKKTNLFITFKNSDFRLLDIKIFPDEATSLDSFSKA